MKLNVITGILLTLFLASMFTLAFKVQPAKAEPITITPPPNWLSGWKYCRGHFVQGSTAGSQTDYQIQITVVNGTGVDSGDTVYIDNKCRSDFGDIRFCNGSGNLLLDYWMEKEHEGENATFWVEIDYIPPFPENVTIYMYYGNDDALTASNGDNTFIFWDNFETDLSKWHFASSTSFPPQVSTDRPYEGERGLKTLKESNYVDVSPNTTTNTAVRVWFYDQMTVYKEKFVLGGSYYEPYYAEIGVDEDKSITHYIYRIGNTAYIGYHISSVSRSVGWHLFEITHDGSTKKFWIDGELQVNTDNNSVVLFGIGSWWDANDEYGYFDVAIQRKYCDPEPLHGAWGRPLILAVGGNVVPIKKLELLIPHIGVISVILVTITILACAFLPQRSQK